MKQWNYLQASLQPDDSEEASAILWGLGTRGIEENATSSGLQSLKAYFDPVYDVHILRKSFKAECQRSGIHLSRCSLKIQIERDWFKKWRQQLRPFTVGKRLLIAPCEPPVEPSDAERLVIHLEPGMAFGTGTHETTQLCLEALERYVSPHMSCMDIGTGSGILAIAALKLGASKVIACDLDPIALEIAQNNGLKNQADRICWKLGDIQELSRYRCRLLVANLTVEIIEECFDRLVRRILPGGYLILSGILNSQKSRIELLRRKSHLELLAQTRKNDWTCLVYRRHVRIRLRA